jgi:hypothetical protein
MARSCGHPRDWLKNSDSNSTESKTHEDNTHFIKKALAHITNTADRWNHDD